MGTDHRLARNAARTSFSGGWSRTGRNRSVSFAYAASLSVFPARVVRIKSAIACAPLPVEHPGQQLAIHIDTPMPGGVSVRLPVAFQLDHDAHPLCLWGQLVNTDWE